MSLSGCLLLILLILISGCSRTEYKPYGDNQSSSVNLSRTVQFHLNPEFEKNPPKCVVVFQPYSIGNAALLRRLEITVVRHLSVKFPRVIWGNSRDLKAAGYSFDLSIPIDRKAFARSANCESVFEFQILKPIHTYLFVWSKVELGLEAKLFRRHDGTELWKARHIAMRSDGGVSLSPFGLTANALEANMLSSDPDVFESVMGDLVRRVMKSIPNMLAADS